MFGFFKKKSEKKYRIIQTGNEYYEIQEYRRGEWRSSPYGNSSRDLSYIQDKLARIMDNDRFTIIEEYSL